MSPVQKKLFDFGKYFIKSLKYSLCFLFLSINSVAYTVGQKSKESSEKLVVTSLNICNCFWRQKPSSISSKSIEKDSTPCSEKILIFSFRPVRCAVFTGASPTPISTERSFEKLTKLWKSESHSFVSVSYTHLTLPTNREV